jgi:hypothetical protein
MKMRFLNLLDFVVNAILSKIEKVEKKNVKFFKNFLLIKKPRFLNNFLFLRNQGFLTTSFHKLGKSKKSIKS